MSSSNGHLLNRMLLGATAGLAGTVALQGIRSASQKYAPSTMPPVRGDPGEFIVNKAEQALPPRIRERIPAKVESAVGKSLGLGYGMFFGAFYALLHGRPRSIISEGAAL